MAKKEVRAMDKALLFRIARVFLVQWKAGREAQNNPFHKITLDTED